MLDALRTELASPNDDPLTRLRRIARSYQAQPSLLRHGGEIVEITSSSVVVAGLSSVAHIGDIVEIEPLGPIPLGQVIRVDTNHTFVRAFQPLSRVRVGMTVWHKGRLSLSPDPSWRGRSFDCFGNPIDSKGPVANGTNQTPVEAAPPSALLRTRVSEPLLSGIKVIDLFTPLCKGQRIGIFSGSGVGKSTLLQMLARSSDFDTIVICLVGERGREVRELLEDGLGHANEKCISVVATSDQSALVRKLAPSTAFTIAEYYRDRGDNVLMLVDSITRFGHAARDVAIAAGEPPTQRGYPPSVFADIAKLLERAGPGVEGAGTITGIFSVLVDGDDHDEPVSDAIRGILDGHVILDRSIASQGRYPAVDPVRSVSRLAPQIWSKDEEKLVHSLKAMISRFEETADLRIISGYESGKDDSIDQSVAIVPILYEFLKQSLDEPECSDVFGAAAQVLREGLGSTAEGNPQ